MENFDRSNPTLIVIYGIDGHAINPRTLTLTLSMFADVLTTIEKTLYPDEQFEFLIEPFENGSFKVSLAKVGEKTLDLAINIFASYIFSLAQPEKPPVITVTPDQVKIEYHDNTIIVPKEQATKYYQTRKNGSINGPIREAFSVLDNDKNVHYMQFSSNLPTFQNPITIPKKNFQNIVQGKEQISNDIYHDSINLTLLNIQSEWKNYSFECLWGDKKISATMHDRGDWIRPSQFRVGDQIIVRLKETQTNDYYTGDLMHSDYEIINVYEHLKK